MIETRFSVRRDAEPYVVLQPTDMDALLDGAADDPEQHLPYWAELWPSGIALASAIMASPAALSGKRVLELGCGLGATAIAALRAGADLIAADYSPESLTLCRYNTLRNTGIEPVTVRLNWRQPGPELYASAGDGFPIVLAADVLYEARDIEPLLTLLDRILAPDGMLWLAEPGRPPASRFLDAARSAGWEGPSSTDAGPWPDPKDDGVVVGVHRLRRA